MQYGVGEDNTWPSYWLYRNFLPMLCILLRPVLANFVKNNKYYKNSLLYFLPKARLCNPCEILQNNYFFTNDGSAIGARAITPAPWAGGAAAVEGWGRRCYSPGSPSTPAALACRRCPPLGEPVLWSIHVFVELKLEFSIRKTS